MKEKFLLKEQNYSDKKFVYSKTWINSETKNADIKLGQIIPLQKDNKL